MARRKNIRINDATDEERRQVKQLFELDFLLAAKRSSRGLFNDPAITTEDMVILLIHQGRIFPSEIKKIIGVKYSRISAIFSILSDKGYLVRETADFDRRKVICSLTKAGKLRVNDIYTSWCENILEAMRTVDSEQFADVMSAFIRYKLDREGGVLNEG